MFWDHVAGVYDIFVNIINKDTHQRLRSIVAETIQPTDDVLECACGTGMLTDVIARICGHVTATDYSAKMLDQAKRNCLRHDNISFALADITSLDYPDESFDKVVAGNVIHLLDQPMKALDELNRVCRPGGMLVIATYMDKDQKGRSSGFARLAGKAGAGFKRQFTVDSYRKFFVDAGYVDVEVCVAQGRIPCAVATMRKRCDENRKRNQERVYQIHERTLPG